MAPFDLEEIEGGPKPLQIALMTKPVLPVPVDAECTAAVEHAARLCESLGHDVIAAEPALDIGTLWPAFGLSSSVGIALKVARREAELGRAAGPGDLEPVHHHNLATGKKATVVEHARARDTLHAASRTLGRFGDEATLLRLAAQLEGAQPWFDRIPVI